MLANVERRSRRGSCCSSDSETGTVEASHVDCPVLILSMCLHHRVALKDIWILDPLSIMHVAHAMYRPLRAASATVPV